MNIQRWHQTKTITNTQTNNGDTTNKKQSDKTNNKKKDNNLETCTEVNPFSIKKAQTRQPHNKLMTGNEIIAFVARLNLHVIKTLHIIIFLRCRITAYSPPRERKIVNEKPRKHMQRELCTEGVFYHTWQQHRITVLHWTIHDQLHNSFTTTRSVCTNVQIKMTSPWNYSSPTS